MTRLVQIKNGDVRRVALVEEPHLRLLDGCDSIYELAQIRAMPAGVKLSEVARQRATARAPRLRPDLQRPLGMAAAAAD